MDKIKLMLTTFSFVLIISLASALAATPHLISLQGYVTDNSDDPLATGNVAVRIYDASTGGNLIYNSGTDYNNAIQNGIFDVLLGSITPLSLDNNVKYYMEIDINGEEVIGDAASGRREFYPGGGEHTHTHDDRYYTELELNTNDGTINQPSDPVSWYKLKDVPAGLADGTDADTTYTAGTGLSLVGTTFAVDTTQTQKRVSGTCAAGSSIRVVNEDGTVSCETDDTGITTCSSCDSTFVNEGQANSITSGMITDETITDDDISNSTSLTIRGLTAGASNKLYVDPNTGKVGIGSFSYRTPMYPLHISDPMSSKVAWESTTASTNAKVWVAETDTNGNWYLRTYKDDYSSGRIAVAFSRNDVNINAITFYSGIVNFMNQSSVSISDISSFSAPSGVFTKVPYNIESYDRQGEYDTVQYTFTPKSLGDYLVCASLFAPSSFAFELDIFKNGAREKGIAGGGDTIAEGCRFIHLEPSDTIDIRVHHTSGITQNFSPNCCWAWLTINKIN